MNLGHGPTRAPSLARAALVAVALLIAFATLFPAPPTRHPPPMFCLVCGSLGGIDVILNIVLFIPLGAALASNGLSSRRALVVCLTTTLAIEVLQFSVVPGRDASIGDLVTNTTGGLLGILLATNWRGWLLPSRAVAIVMASSSALLFVAVTAGTAHLLNPRLRRLALWGQLAPQEHPNFAPYRGSVHRFVVAGVEIPYNRVLATDLERLYAGWSPPSGSADITTGEAASGISAIARLGSSVEEVYFLGEDGRDLLFRTTLDARKWRLRVPSVRLEGAFRRPGERMTIEGAIEDRGWLVRAHRPGHVLERRVPFAVSLGWSMLLPFDRPIGSAYRWFGATWLALLMLPCGYWSGRAASADGKRRGGRRWVAGLLPAVSLALGVGGVALHHALRAPHWSEWIGGASGALLGAVLAHRVANRMARRAAP